MREFSGLIWAWQLRFDPMNSDVILTSKKSPPAVVLTRMSAAYGAVVVLRNIELELARGEVLAVLGRNGVGKTTLVETLFNLGPTVTGDVVINGQRVTGWATNRIARLGIALVPQGRGVFPDLTVDEALRIAQFGASKRVRPWTLERAYETFPRLAMRRRMFSGALSGGERQMLAIARALMMNAEILVLDEPSEGLAPLAIEEVIVSMVTRLAGEGMTVLLAEQNVAMALRLASRAVVLAGGGIVFNGDPQALVEARELQREYLGV
jgi:branched-chain amino acid transport system ATP-binding protein